MVEDGNHQDVAPNQDFCRYVLSIDNTTEDELDERLRNTAESLKMTREVALFNSRLEDSYENIRSPSTESQATSTASTNSIWSRERQSFQSNAAEESSRTSISSSITSNSNISKRHSLSDSLTISRSPFRMILGLSALRLSRGERAGCQHCPKDGASQRRALHELPCGHRVCTQALRGMVVPALESSLQPQCCQQAIPDRFVRHVLGEEAYTSHVSQVATTSTQARRLSRLSIQSKVDSLIPLSEEANDRVLASSSYRELRTEQDAQMARFEEWSRKQESEIENHRVVMNILRRKHAADLAALAAQHNTAMNDAEDKQVQAEADLRDLQEREKKDNATALRHIEAFCDGKLASGEVHNRTVTEQDLAALKTAQDLKDVLELKHTNAINVLRGEQELRIKVRIQRQDREIAELESQQRKEEAVLEIRQQKEKVMMNDDIIKKRQRLCARWDLEIAICLKKLIGENDSTNFDRSASPAVDIVC